MTLKTFDHLEQGSTEWLDARRGMLTASTIGSLVGERTLTAVERLCPACESMPGDPCIGTRGGPIKTPHTERAAYARENPMTVVAAMGVDDMHSLALTIAAERIVQFTEHVYVTGDMLRGQEDEPLAVAEYERRTGRAVTHTGFMTNTIRGHVVGYSPDGLVDDNGLIECKSRKSKKQLSTMLTDTVPPENLAQLHMGLMVSEREWIDYVSYAGGWPAHIIRVIPDPQWQSAIGDAVERFEDTVEAMVLDWHNRYGSLPRTERIEYGEDVTF